MIMWIISVVSLLIVMVSCVLGIFSPARVYDDNLAQRIGMAGVFVFSWPRLSQLLETQMITNNCMPASAQLVGHVGLACFCVGSIAKTVLRNNRSRGLVFPVISKD